MTLFLTLFLDFAFAGPPPKPIPREAVVTAVYDGDTVTLDTGDKVRLRGVNTPELKPAEDFGVDAREATRAFLLNQRVQLLVTGDDARDGYGRIVAGLKTEAGDLALHLAERGLGHVFVIPPDPADLTPLIEAQARARAQKLGIWSTPRYQGDLHITSFHANGKGDDDADPNAEYLRVCNVGVAPVDLSAYKLQDGTGRSWDLPQVVLPVGHTVKIHSGKGEHQADPSAQIAVYLQSSRGVWDDTSAVVRIVDSTGKEVDHREHAVGADPSP